MSYIFLLITINNMELVDNSELNRMLAWPIKCYYR